MFEIIYASDYREMMVMYDNGEVSDLDFSKGGTLYMKPRFHK